MGHVALFVQSNTATKGRKAGRQAGQNLRPISDPPARPLRTKDGRFSIAAPHDFSDDLAMFAEFAGVVGNQLYVADPRTLCGGPPYLLQSMQVLMPQEAGDRNLYLCCQGVGRWGFTHPARRRRSAAARLDRQGDRALRADRLAGPADPARRAVISVWVQPLHHRGACGGRSAGFHCRCFLGRLCCAAAERRQTRGKCCMRVLMSYIWCTVGNVGVP